MRRGPGGEDRLMGCWQRWEEPGRRRPGGQGSDWWALALVGPRFLRSVKLEETLDIVQSSFGLPTCLAHKVFKCLN